ncbi:MAG: hypothetical protein R3357_09365 [Burkholderiales bacterium]|nr:hypothetical protein [Burkholderiales bacterium]
MRLSAILVLVLWAALVWALPYAGLMLAGQPLGDLLAFPPRPRAVAHAPFAWPAFAFYAVPAAGAIALYAYAVSRARFAMGQARRAWFPWWGWLGLVLLAASWTLAWRGDLVDPEWRRHVFTPLWLGAILAMNARVWRTTGESLLTHRSRWFLALFPVSAAFWWLFEHLNRFAGNWRYEGIVASGDWDYFLQATLPFATVLPAVASAWRWLQLSPSLDTRGLPPIEAPPVLAWIALALGAAGLVGVGLRPDALFSMLWLAPLALLAALQRLLTGASYFAPLARGDWRPLLQPALAALACGLLWELWNWGSLAKWHYSVPYVQRFHLFEMPLLGYAGYLPFGLECALVMDLVARALGRRGVWPLDAHEKPKSGSDPCG